MTDPEQLLRRTFAAHEADVDPQALRRIAAALTQSPRPRESRMSHDGDTTAGVEASADVDTDTDVVTATNVVIATNADPAAHPGPDRRRRRWIPWLVGVAAGVAIVAVLIGSFGRDDDRSPTAAATTHYSALPSRAGELSASDRRIVLERIDDALRRHGTLSVTMSPVDARTSPAGSPPMASGSGAPNAATVFELDVREPAVTRWRAGGASTLIRDDAWPSADGSLTTPTDRVQPTPTDRQRAAPPFAKHARTLLAFMWPPDDRDRVVVIGEETSDGRRLVHYQFAATIGDGGEKLPPDTGKDDGRGRLDVWVADDGTIIRGSMRHDFDEWRADSITYGADVTITPPPSGPAYGSAHATGP